MIHALARHGGRGHQYLPPDRGRQLDDAVVELEYSGPALPTSGKGRFIGDEV
jgi:hypothetical protein